jgi:hypothetical protein
MAIVAGALPRRSSSRIHPPGPTKTIGLTASADRGGVVPPKEPRMANFPAHDAGIIPWAPLMQFDGPPESVLERCAERIEREAEPQQRTDFLVVAQVMAGLRFPGLDLLTIFGGQKAMIESPLILKVKAEAVQESILEILKDRFESVPREVTKLLRAEMNEKKLKKLAVLAGKCSNPEAFRDALQS